MQIYSLVQNQTTTKNQEATWKQVIVNATMSGVDKMYFYMPLFYTHEEVTSLQAEMQHYVKAKKLQQAKLFKSNIILRLF